MDLNEARALLDSPIWPKVRDGLAATGVFAIHPAGDPRRMEYLEDGVRREIARWAAAAAKLPEWRKVVDGAEVRRLKAENPGVYPEILRYAAYLEGRADVVKAVMRHRFPEAYAICFS